MVSNNALIVYLAIDSRLRRQPSPTLTDLIEAVEERLSGKPISARSVTMSIERMRYHSGLRFFAPIQAKRISKKTVYKYADEEYCIVRAIEKMI